VGVRSSAIGQTSVDKSQRPLCSFRPQEDPTRSGRPAVEGVHRMHPRTDKCLTADGSRNMVELESEVGRKNYIFLAVSITFQFKVYMHPNIKWCQRNFCLYKDIYVAAGVTLTRNTSTLSITPLCLSTRAIAGRLPSICIMLVHQF
jgi:hypothetical protein